LKIKNCYILFLLIISQISFAQNVRLFLQKDNASVKVKEKQTFKNAKEVQQYLAATQQKLVLQGYLEASFDSIKQQHDSIFANLHTGKRYEIKNPSTELNKKKKRLLSIKSKQTTSTVYDADITKEALITNFENNGYPFAKVSSDSIQLNDSSLSFSYTIDKGKLITIDSFINHGSSKLTKGFIQNYVLIKSKQPYNELRIKEIDKLLQKLPYAIIRQPSNILFRDNKADIHLYLDKRKVNSFDFLIGFLPGSNRGKILITGEVRVHLQNSFKRGEEIYLEWRKLQRQSQLLDVRFNYPYLLNAPIGVNFTFNLEKRDSSSLDLAWQLGIPYITSSNNYIKGFYKYFQTIVLAADTTFAKLNKKLPNNLDATYNQYGVQAYYEDLDYLFSPQKGYELKLTGSIGTKKIKPNNQITTLQDDFSDFNYESLYDSIKRKSIKGDIFWIGNYYLPLGKKQRHILKFGLNGGSVFNQNLLRNELLRIGGSRLLRGFDEQSIFASTYNVTTLEYRMMIMRNSYFFVFMDAAYIRRKFNSTTFQDFPFGFGAGITFETKIGIFGLTYALGQQKDKSVDFRNSKLHFGYVATF
jgi:outer membrane translocation and assembly module TamA